MFLPVVLLFSRYAKLLKGFTEILSEHHGSNLVEATMFLCQGIQCWVNCSSTFFRLSCSIFWVRIACWDQCQLYCHLLHCSPIALTALWLLNRLGQWSYPIQPELVSLKRYLSAFMASLANMDLSTGFNFGYHTASHSWTLNFSTLLLRSEFVISDENTVSKRFSWPLTVSQA